MEELIVQLLCCLVEVLGDAPEILDYKWGRRVVLFLIILLMSLALFGAWRYYS